MLGFLGCDRAPTPAPTVPKYDLSRFRYKAQGVMSALSDGQLVIAGMSSDGLLIVDRVRLATGDVHTYTRRDLVPLDIAQNGEVVICRDADRRAVAVDVAEGLPTRTKSEFYYEDGGGVEAPDFHLAGNNRFGIATGRIVLGEQSTAGAVIVTAPDLAVVSRIELDDDYCKFFNLSAEETLIAPYMRLTQNERAFRVIWPSAGLDVKIESLGDWSAPDRQGVIGVRNDGKFVHMMGPAFESRVVWNGERALTVPDEISSKNKSVCGDWLVYDASKCIRAVDLKTGEHYEIRVPRADKGKGVTVQTPRGTDRYVMVLSADAVYLFDTKQTPPAVVQAGEVADE